MLGMKVRTTIMASVYKKVSGICQASPKKIPFVNVSISSQIEENLTEMITDLNTGFWLNTQPSLDISLEMKMKSVYTNIERLCVWGWGALQGKAGKLFSARDLPFSFEGLHTVPLFLPLSTR